MWKIHIWKLNNTHLYSSWAKEEVSREFRKYSKLNGNKSTMYQNSWNVANSVLRGKYTVLNVYFRKEQESEIKVYMLLH